MEFFKTYVSNTIAGSGNQCFFQNEREAPTRSRTFYRVQCGGEYPYSFLFSNTIDSTYAKGEISQKNLVMDAWTIEEMRVGVTSRCDEVSFEEPQEMHGVFFGGERKKTVAPGDLFCTDPVTLKAKQGEYVCVEVVFSGKRIPNHKESRVPSFVDSNGAWIPSKDHPFVSMVGIRRSPKLKIGFLGDSITQGIGPPINSYLHWNAVLAEHLGNEYAYWNLGLGYARADDAASDGIWLRKAKENHVVFLCFGINDIIQGFAAEEVKRNLQTIVEKLAEAGVRVIVQTAPPFDFEGERLERWAEVNRFIKEDLKGAERIFDCVPYLAKSEAEPHLQKYGKHPNGEGCRLWGEALLEAVKPLLNP